MLDQTGKLFGPRDNAQIEVVVSNCISKSPLRFLDVGLGGAKILLPTL
jgi:hypothetical protein